MDEIMFVLYVKNKVRSTKFYKQVLQINPCLDVPGMTEFSLSNHLKLGLIPEDGIAKIISTKMPHPKTGAGIPRCELYLKVNDASKYMKRCIELGGTKVSDLKNRDWGDKVGYVADPDGHIIAFAEKI